jgi:hypothetical protein
LTHNFRDFSPWVAGSTVCGTSKAKHHGRRAWRSKVSHLMVSRKKKGREEGTRNKIQPLDTPPMTYFLQLGLTS